MGSSRPTSAPPQLGATAIPANAVPDTPGGTPMTALTVFCSACDRNVALVPRSPDWIWHALLDTRPRGDVACLDFGRRCTGTLCPFSAEIATGGDLEEASRPALPAPN